MPDYLTLIKDKEQEQSELDVRMQTDANLLYLKKYVMRDTAKAIVPDIINITLNRPRIFADNVISALGNANQQTIVVSDDQQIDTHEVEEFQEAAFASADAKLRRRPGYITLNAFADAQLCIRGRTARRVLFRMEDGVVLPDIIPWDGRYVYYETGLNGLVWAAYKTTRSKARIESEYGIAIRGKEGVVLDVWDDTHNEVWIDGQKRREQGHPFFETPVVIQVVSLGYGAALMDTNRIEHEGESIFSSVRDIIPELNRLASILATLNLKAVKPPMKQIRRGGGEASEYDDVTDMGTITSMDVGEDVEPINFGDAKRAAEMLYNIMEKAMQAGSITDVDLGNLQFPLSAVALVELGEGRDQVYLPRLDAKAMLNQSTAEMFTRQVIQMGGTVELGTPGHKRKFSTKKLMGEYETTYKYYTKSPKIDIARMTMAQAAERYYDPETILKEILQVEDWEGIMQKRYFYMAEEVSPLIRDRRIIMKLLELAEDGDEDAANEARLMAESMGLTVAQIKAGQLPPPPEPQKPPEPVMPLLGEGGGVGGIPSSAQKAAMLQARLQGSER